MNKIAKLANKYFGAEGVLLDFLNLCSDVFRRNLKNKRKKNELIVFKK